MSDHIQIAVLKQGSHDVEHWSQRTLTIDGATETATISRHDHPKDLYHHTMRVLAVQKWPELKTTNSGHGHDSAEAKMTLHLIGVKVPTLKFGNEDAKSTTSTGTGAHTPATGGTTPAERPSPSNNARPEDDVDASWMIRCTSKETYDTTVKALEAIIQARLKREAAQPKNHTQYEKDEEALKKFPLPENATAPVVVPTARHGPIM